MPHFCSEPSSGSSACSESKLKTLPGPVAFFTTLFLTPVFPTLVSLLLTEHIRPSLVSGPLTSGFFWLKSSLLPFSQASVKHYPIREIPPPPPNHLSPTSTPYLLYPAFYFPITCIITLKIHLFDCLLLSPTPTTRDHKLHEGLHFCFVHCCVSSTKQHLDL